MVSILCATILNIHAQDKNPDFRHPMDLPIEVAGNFMELRTNHFHSGLDMKTNGRIGLPVMSVADGWVSRIKISPWGYGKAVYVDHPSGYTTVYGHLDRLNGKLASTLLDLQYAERSFSVDRYFKQGELPISKGEVIAYSGNTGGSTAPHLHFEVRRSSDQRALDPQAYGMTVQDRVHPTITGIRIYPLDSSARVSPYPTGAVGFVVSEVNDSTFVLKPGTLAKAFGTVGIAVNTTDRYSNSNNTCGIRTLSVSVDGGTVFSAGLNEIDFGTTRYANAYMDHSLFKDNNMHYNRCYKLPNNQLNVYGKEAAQGRIQVEPGKDHAVQVIATDAAGNRSMLTFVLHGAKADESATWPVDQPPGQLYHYDRSNVIMGSGMRFSLPPNALYDDTHIITSVSAAPAHALSPLFQVQDELTPLQKSGELTLDVTGEYPAAQASKLLVVRMVKGRPSAEGGTFSNGKVTASVRALGAFTVMMDTVAPVITPLDLRADMKGRSSFRIRVRDNLAGMDQWSGKIDGQWILLEYEPNSATLEHTFDKNTDKPGSHEFTLEVSDERGNRSQISRAFTR
ncbi:MAG: M23 family metallopeptidase [Flavobacteriales bacterium]|nr:M23 family metallopeptidase [Flavobacteriales bacterium]